MKQLFQSLSDGKTCIQEVPIPNLSKGNLLIKTHCSLLSSGTERMLIEFGKSNLIGKAKQQPDKVKEVLNKLKTDGILSTIETVKNKLELPIPLGYCNVGEVIRIGEEVSGFKLGDRVISNGSHAEIVSVPKNLCALIPNEVSNDRAVFTVPASIALQGIRLAEPTFGEKFVVIGLGLIGLLTAQVLLAQGCEVIGIDNDFSKCKFAEKLGIKTFHNKEGFDSVDVLLGKSDYIGFDGILIAASTPSSEPINFAAKICRKKGRIILIGSTGIDISRDNFYKKELTFKVSCSYGPGRYDQSYENDGQDYPIGYVRWTEQRNFKAILSSMEKNLIKPEVIISSKFEFKNALEAYDELLNDKASLGIVLEYTKSNNNIVKSTIILNKDKNPSEKNLLTDFIGGGNYAGKTLIPIFKQSGAKLNTLSTISGLNSSHLGKKFGFKKITTNRNLIFDEKEANILAIASQHDSHAEYIIKGLKEKRKIFVEKPLCINRIQFNEIKKTYLDLIENNRNNSTPILMVGYNRRFSKFIKKIKTKIDQLNCPKAFIYKCNAGYIPESHWTQDRNKGGGRLIGEACHFIDLLRFLANDKIKNINFTELVQENSLNDTFTLNITFVNGSIGTVHYFSNGNKSYPKETLEIFAENSIIKLDNFRKIRSWGINLNESNNFRQDKGQKECIRSFLETVRLGKEQPIPINEIFEVQDWILKIMN
ncbi:Gfo/Idh/MocA family oxidoreductase [Prochlorococcus marinus XMU1411]|uniref:bi-domain-containing oxidoreductase n=1 Tax=Prochlorococcus marinus TaxID=1219 RepID=UPI001ADB3CA7|nr:bi-domain-containing oxidoreductase [Prochlorococcus marinus]MBO8244202.1 Gfo/Idh/MocA family oxidoreductase [Prochlorococcus marinus XMU1411]MBW3055287.1 dehydrogenase [Prochlorococcus marinus str. MU1411]MCR8537030.1 bi-domain-containing oxidoreductase [Prochlorococcus marinus CUG1430]